MTEDEHRRGNAMTEIDPQVTITCASCGRRIRRYDEKHSEECRPRLLYWWPREHPYAFAVLALIAGLIVGWRL